MKKKHCYIRVLVSAILLPAVFCGTVSAATLAVGPAETYTTIQGAVDAAAVGDTINVQAGTYSENVVIATNNLTLKSVDGDGLAIIDGDGVTSAVSIGSALGVTIDGFAVDGNGQYGIYSAGGAPTDPMTIINNTIQDCTSGFYASFSYMEGTFTFTDNTISDCTSAGLHVYGFDGAVVLVSRNAVTDCATGIQVDETSEGVESDVTVSYNTITATATFSGTYGLYTCCPETTTTFSNNTITGDFTYGLYMDCPGCCGTVPGIVYVEGNTVTGAEYGYYLYEISCSFEATVYVSGNTATDCDYGMYFDSTPCCDVAEVYVENNTLTNNLYGLYFADLACCYSIDLGVTGNTIADNYVGLYVGLYTVVSGSTLDITNNNICGNTTWGFENASGEDVPVDDNWWGDPSGPSGDGPGTGDAISTGFVPTTFLAAPYGSSGGGGDDGGCAGGFPGSSGMAGTLAMLALALLSMRKKTK